MSRLWDVAKHEFHEVLPPTLFFLIRTIGRKQVQIMFFGAPGTSPARTH